MDYSEVLFDKALDAVVGMDSAGRVTAWNAAAEDIFGWSRVEAIGASLSELIVPPQHRESHARGLEHYNRTGEGPVLEQRIHITAVDRTGSEFPIELSIIALNGADQEPIFYAFIRSRAAEEAFHHEHELRAREAEVVMKVGQKLIEEISLDEFTKFCLEEVCEVAGMDAAHLFIVRGQGATQILVPSGIWHLRDERFRPVIEATSRIKFERGQGLPGRAWQSGKLEALENLIDDCKFIRREVFTKVGLTRGVALPVSHGGRIHAVLEFFGMEISRLDPEILRLLKTVGNQIGAAIRGKEGAESRETLRREMVHRVGNSLTILSSIYRNCSRRAATKEELDEMFLNRVMAIGRANKIAIVEAERGISLTDVIKDSLVLLPDEFEIKIDAPQITLCSDAVMPFSLILHELGTNALKYGSLDDGSWLDIQVSSCDESGELKFTWREQRHVQLDAPPLQPTRRGFGTQLIEIMVESRLGGSFNSQLDETGFHFNARFPKNQLQSDACPA